MKKTIKNKPEIIENTSLNKINYFVLFFLIILAFILRLYFIDAPVADHHSWRQADTAAVARNFTRIGFDLLYPRYDDLSSIETGANNPEGYRFVEFPFYNALFAAFYKYFPLFSLEMTGRLTTVIFSLILLAIIYYITTKEVNKIAGFFAGLTFAIMPFFVFYSRVILPDMNAISLMFIGIFFLYKWSKNKNWFLYFLSLIFVALALLTKPTVIFYLLVILYLFFSTYKFGLFKKISVYFYFFIIIMPFLAWRFWIAKHPEGIPYSDWLITHVNTYEGLKDIFFKPAFFRWIFYERIANMIMGSYLLVFLFLGILKKQKNLLLHSIGLSALIYLFTFQGGNVQHDYYQTLILPALAIFTGVGVSLLFSEKKIFINPFISSFVVIAVYVASFAFSYYQVKDFYSFSDNLVKIGKIISTLTEPDARVVTDTSGDTTLLYLSDRKGYPAKNKEFDALKKDGMNYFVTYNKETGEQMKKDYFELIFENESFYLFRL